ncbi:tetratricopeptide repeat protein [Flavobacterium pectinovorum]|uniref:tetratricopeptide repeat protein n=1 Tax=Flavobacterium pectinovorum TaxID=29533 RepID=UPI001FAE0477|nr:tetratricopeptide repeat protein [Flavobacterium pectinovorum]MCI9843927.1 tetratricopeptide repeat protein [Flavobacterium pectinovorum]
MNFKRTILLFLLLMSTLFYAQKTNELITKLNNHTKKDTLRCYFLDQVIESESNHTIWIKHNNELKKITQEKSQSETNPALKKAYLKYLSIAYNNEGAFLIYTEEFEKAILVYKKSFRITTKINYTYGSALALQNIGTAFDYLGKLDSTLVYMQQAYSCAKHSKDKTNLAYILTDLGFVYNNLGNNSLAIKHNLEALPLFEKTNNLEGLERTYFALGRIFDSQKDFETSISYYEKCLKIDKQIKNQERLTLVLINLATTNNNLGRLKKALYFNKQAFLLAKKTDNSDLIAATYKNFADTYFKKNDLQNSEINYLKSAKLYKSINSQIMFSKICISLSTVYLTTNKLALAKEYASKGYYLTKKTNSPSDEKNAAGILSQIYFKQNDFKNAYLFKSIAINISEKIYFDESKDIALKATYQYETEKKEATIKELNQKKKIAELESNKKNILINSIIISFLALTLIAYFLFSRYRENKKNELLKTQLIETQKRLEAEKKATDSELKALKSQMNPHFIFNALNSIQEQFMYGDKLKANEQLSNFTYLTRQILEVSGKKQITIAAEIDILTKYLELEKMRFAKDFEYTITTSEIIDEDYIKLSPMLLQPFLENSIKHGLLHKKGLKIITINFDLSLNEKYLICTIIDNGIGRQKSTEIKAGNLENHNSFSIKSIQQRLELLNDNLQLQELILYTDIKETDVLVGTKVVVNIPLV